MCRVITEELAGDCGLLDRDGVLWTGMAGVLHWSDRGRLERRAGAIQRALHQ